MCLVFRARHKQWNLDCALKVLREDWLDDSLATDLFITEADLSLLLKHPNLMHAYDAGQIGERSYIAMELITGGTLAELISFLNEADTRLNDDLALYIVTEVLSGLQAFHSSVGKSGRPLEVLHRDVTPHNIFLTQEGRVLLGDFGAAHVQAHGSMFDTKSSRKSCIYSSGNSQWFNDH